MTVTRAFSATPTGSKFLIGLCLLDFAILVTINGGLPLGLFGPSAHREAVIGAGGVSGSLASLQPWRLLSATFVHLSVLHLAMNVFALHSFGPAFERRHGGARLVLLYTVTGSLGFLLSSFLYGWSGPLTAGASGAIFGLIGAEVGELVVRRHLRASEVFFQYVFVAVALALLMPVNNFAHLGGFLSGSVAGLFLGRGKRPR